MTVVQLFTVQPEKIVTGSIFSSALFPFGMFHRDLYLSTYVLLKNAPLSFKLSF